MSAATGRSADGAAGPVVDINCDMGESFGPWRMGDDEAMMELISSANIACGFHAGDPLTMARTVRLAREHDVALGAHPGFPDMLGFGRRKMPLEPDEAAAYVRYQAGALAAFARAHGAELHHVKPHGAFYALLRDDPALADAVADAIAGVGDGIALYWPGPPGGALCDALGERGVMVVDEGYPDLTYDPSGTLVIQRTKRKTDLEFAAAQVRSFLERGTMQAEDGSEVPVVAQSLCIHGDGPNAVEVAQVARREIEASGRTVAALPGATR